MKKIILVSILVINLISLTYLSFNKSETLLFNIAQAEEGSGSYYCYELTPSLIRIEINCQDANGVWHDLADWIVGGTLCQTVPVENKNSDEDKSCEWQVGQDPCTGIQTEISNCL